MSSNPPAGTGTVELHLDAALPSVALLEVDDAAGRRVARRRVRDLHTTLTLPAGSYRLTVTDDRELHDPTRLAGSTVEVEVADDEDVAATLTLTRAAVLRATTARWARVTAVGPGGERHTVSADGHGTAVVAGLRAGTWTVVAHDPRRDRCSRVASTELTTGTTTVDLAPTTRTGRVLVQVRGTDRRPVRATEIIAVDVAGRRVVAPVVGGVADLRGLCPGPVRVTVPASVGHRGVTVAVESEAGVLSTTTAVVPVGASVVGRVVMGSGQYAAVVALLDDDGREIERTRTDARGRFELGTGLGTRADLTLVATTGPETLHVTRAAVAEVMVLGGVRHDLGEIALPAAGPRAVWKARTPAVAGMRLPSTRV